MAKEGGMQAGLFVIIGLIFSWGLGPPPVVAADMSLMGKLTISVTGREQALFEKASVKFEKLRPRVRVRFAATDGGDPLADLAGGSADIAVLGRTLKPEEKEWTGTTVGWEGIASWSKPPIACRRSPSNRPPISSAGRPRPGMSSGGSRRGSRSSTGKRARGCGPTWSSS